MREIYSRTGVVVMLAVVGAAWRWGDRRGRAVATIVAVGWVALLLVQVALRQAGPWRVMAAMDAGVFAALLRATWRRTPDWAILILAFQAVTLGVHVIRALSPHMSTWTYMTALAITGYGVLACLAWGTWTARRARRLGIHS